MNIQKESVTVVFSDSAKIGLCFAFVFFKCLVIGLINCVLRSYTVISVFINCYGVLFNDGILI